MFGRRVVEGEAPKDDAQVALAADGTETGGDTSLAEGIVRCRRCRPARGCRARAGSGSVGVWAAIMAVARQVCSARPIRRAASCCA